MKSFATLTDANGTEALGSFGTIQLDGRNSLDTMISDSISLMNRENKFSGRVRFTGFYIHRGESLRSTNTIYTH